MNDADLIEALESSMFLLSEIPGRLEYLEVPGVTGWMTQLPYAAANRVGLAALPEDEADEIICSARDIFAAEGRGFLWVVGPRRAPPDIGSRLTAAGRWASG